MSDAVAVSVRATRDWWTPRVHPRCGCGRPAAVTHLGFRSLETKEGVTELTRRPIDDRHTCAAHAEDAE